MASRDSGSKSGAAMRALHPTTVGEAADAFLGYLKRRNRSPLTIKQYKPTLDLLVEWAGDVSPASITTAGIDFGFLVWWEEQFIERNGREPSAQTTKAIHGVLGSFYAFLSNYGFLTDEDGGPARNPMLAIQRPSVKQRRNDWLRKSEDDALLDTPMSEIEEILVWLFRWAGLRISEGLNLRNSDIDFVEGTIRVLALAGRRVVWNVRSGGNCLETLVYTATLDEHSPRRIYDMGFCGDFGTMPTGIAGGGATLVFTQAEFEYEPGPPEFEPGGGCTRVSGGRTARVVGTSTATVPGSAPAVRLAVSAGRVALVPADPTCTDLPGVLAPVPNGTVELRSAGDGGLVSSFSPAGTVRAVALSGTEAVVLVEAADGSKRVERYHAGTGTLFGATPVQPVTATNLDIAGGWIVYRTGRAIRLIDAVTGGKRLLVTAPAAPLGLSIESRRVAWAENRLGHGRVRSVLAPLRPKRQPGWGGRLERDRL